MRHRWRAAAVAAVVVALAVSGVLTGSTRAPAVDFGGCSYYASNAGFGYSCGNYGRYGTPQSWSKDLADAGKTDRDFIPCKILDIPPALKNQVAKQPLKHPEDSIVLLETMTGQDLQTNNPPGGPDVKFTYGFTELTPAQQEQCKPRDYMERFWINNTTTYPVPVLSISPLLVPRVNAPTFFYLNGGSGTARVGGAGNGKNYAYDGREWATMKADVLKLQLVFQDSSHESPMTCSTMLEPYQPSQPANQQKNDCVHVFKHSSAGYANHAIKVRIIESWQVSYLVSKAGGGQWHPIDSGSADGLYHVEWDWQIQVQSDQGIVTGG